MNNKIIFSSLFQGSPASVCVSQRNEVRSDPDERTNDDDVPEESSPLPTTDDDDDDNKITKNNKNTQKDSYYMPG